MFVSVSHRECKGASGSVRAQRAQQVSVRASKVPVPAAAAAHVKNAGIRIAVVCRRLGQIEGWQRGL